MRLFDVRNIVVYGGKSAIWSSDTTTSIAPEEFMRQISKVIVLLVQSLTHRPSNACGEVTS